jgi:hypothetical protein
MADGIDITNLRLSSIDTRLTELSADVKVMRSDLDSIKASARFLRIVLSIAGAGILALVVFAGNAVIENIARRVVREELAYRATTVQQGKFSAATKVSDEPLSFAWKLKVPVDPAKVTMLAAEPLTPLPGVAVSAKLSDDGTSCIMTLYGDEETLAALPTSVDAKVTIATRE